MRISNLGIPATPLGSPPAEPVAAGTGQAAANGSTESSSYSPSPELVKLVSLASQQPEVRPEVVQAASLRLQQGHYHSPVAAENTASAIIQSAD